MTITYAIPQERSQVSANPFERPRLRAISENEMIPVVTMPMARAMMKTTVEAVGLAPTEEFTPQTVSVTAHVNALFTLK